ncbi:hypothetical protein SCB49_11382 [unidentified eubacterium SCB49]|nr:hypothetical protein SCB49_11382 [unidentified eubacterium SCB49]
MTRDELQPVWEKIVDIGFSDYEKLTKAERVWFNVEPLITDGIVDHYINYGAEHNADTIEDLETLEFTNVANLMRKMNSKFPNGAPATDIEKRAEQMENWDEKHGEFIENIDKEFWGLSNELEKKLYLYVNEMNVS